MWPTDAASLKARQRELAGPGSAGDPTYAPGLLALRIGTLMEEAVRALRTASDVLLVDGTGRDHPRRHPPPRGASRLADRTRHGGRAGTAGDGSRTPEPLRRARQAAREAGAHLSA